MLPQSNARYEYTATPITSDDWRIIEGRKPPRRVELLLHILKRAHNKPTNLDRLPRDIQYWSIFTATSTCNAWLYRNNLPYRLAEYKAGMTRGRYKLFRISFRERLPEIPPFAPARIAALMKGCGIVRAHFRNIEADLHAAGKELDEMARTLAKMSISHSVSIPAKFGNQLSKSRSGRSVPDPDVLMTTRLRNCLANNGLTLASAATRSAKELLAMRRFGNACLRELDAILDERDMRRPDRG
jgi:hypothetical protein